MDLNADQLKKDIGKRLKFARERKGLKQNRIAKTLGVHNSTLSKYESGERELDNETLVKLSELYEVSPQWIITGEDQEVKEKNNAETTIQLIETEAKKMGLSPDDPLFQEMLVDAFKLLRFARGQNQK